MPPLRFWLHCAAAFVITTGTALMTALTLAMTNNTSLHPYAWLIAILGGLIEACREGGKSWPSSL